MKGQQTPRCSWTNSAIAGHPSAFLIETTSLPWTLKGETYTYKLEVLSGTSQYGQTFDEWGRHFGVNNPNTGRHEVIAARYLERNPDLLLSSVMSDLSEDRHVSYVTERPESPRKEAGLQNFGRITSACSITFYMGAAFPEKYRNIAFIAEPAHNSVLAHTWSPSGASFVAERLRPDREFLASKDGWSRPVNFYVGPDGALYVIDYYRRVIEHPEWTSREVYESEAIYHGNDKGRIYRIVPANDPPSLPSGIRLGDASRRGSGNASSAIRTFGGGEPRSVCWSIAATKARLTGSLSFLERLNRRWGSCTLCGHSRALANWTRRSSKRPWTPRKRV